MAVEDDQALQLHRQLYDTVNRKIKGSRRGKMLLLANKLFEWHRVRAHARVAYVSRCTVSLKYCVWLAQLLPGARPIVA